MACNVEAAWRDSRKERRRGQDPGEENADSDNEKPPETEEKSFKPGYASQYWEFLQKSFPNLVTSYQMFDYARKFRNRLLAMSAECNSTSTAM